MNLENLEVYAAVDDNGDLYRSHNKRFLWTHKHHVESSLREAYSRKYVQQGTYKIVKIAFKKVTE